MLRRFAVLLVSVASALAFDWTATPFNPHSIPLAVRTPYLSTWLSQGEGAALNDRWAEFWTGHDQVMAWTGYIRVDGKVYTWMGAPNTNGSEKAVQTDMEFTSSSTNFNLAAGAVDIIVTFLSPVLPTDLKRQSLPLSYISLTVSSSDGDEHDVQVYLDISSEWATGDTNAQMKWDTHLGDIISHEVQLADQAPFEEANQESRSGSAFFSAYNSSALTYMSGADADVRAKFIADGKLDNSKDTAFRAANDRWPVFAFAQDLGSVSCMTDSVVFSIGHLRDPAFQLIQADGSLQERAPYFLTEFATFTDAIKFFMDDFEEVSKLADDFDNKVKDEAGKHGDDYVGIVELSMRQAFAGMELSVSRNADGSLNKGDVIDGNMNTVDVVFPTWPALLWGNPVLGKLLLEPLFAYQASGQYPNPWAVHDMGANYPKALGHNDGKDEAMQVEESGNMLIMTYSYLMKTGDKSQAEKYYNLLEQWTGFLITDSLIPGDQLSTDDFQGHLANQTNLAIKGICGIASMGKIAEILGKTDQAQNYSSIAADYAQKVLPLGMSSDGKHLTLKMGDDSTWGLAYNLYADRLLDLKLFDDSLYATQDAWYKANMLDFGIQLDTRNARSKTDWELWIASIADDELKGDIISRLKKYISSGLGDKPFGDLYDASTGSVDAFRARPVVGGHLALMALDAQKPASKRAARSQLLRGGAAGKRRL
ncbi:DUF1793-domain-containing protein [Auriculariales sp. MPI-PUGE-AT-0066]|nr:DUF1793-domain-containing protein [Auriculariales sp. MPI-PUGE-AT-0066]